MLFFFFCFACGSQHLHSLFCLCWTVTHYLCRCIIWNLVYPTVYLVSRFTSPAFISIITNTDISHVLSEHGVVFDFLLQPPFYSFSVVVYLFYSLLFCILFIDLLLMAFFFCLYFLIYVLFFLPPFLSVSLLFFFIFNLLTLLLFPLL